MTETKTTISTRLGEADTEFLQRLEINGATTPSEKLRKMVTQARQRAGGAGSFREASNLLDDLLRPTRRIIAEHEHRTGTRSEPLEAMVNALAGALAELLAANRIDPDDREAMRALEARTIGQANALCTQILRLGLAPRVPCYDPSVLESPRARIYEVLDRLASETLAHQHGEQQ